MLGIKLQARSCIRRNLYVRLREECEGSNRCHEELAEPCCRCAGLLALGFVTPGVPRSPQSWGYFGINSAALVAQPGPFMLIRCALCAPSF